MASDNTITEMEKKNAALEALKFVTSGMIVGLGTGSTVRFFLDGLGKAVRRGIKVRCVATSRITESIAKSNGIEILDSLTELIDLTVDGADEIDRYGNLIKGGGGALLREKIVAANSKRLFIIADHTKLKDRLGSFKVPVEVFPFLDRLTKAKLEALNGKCYLREGFITDNGNLIYDCDFGLIERPEELEGKIKNIPGVAEVGIFTNLHPVVLIGDGESVRELKLLNIRSGKT
ncbi:MAG TPA: ribose-5-phosphate isomerase RpiA [Thermoplasmataceae archaeon]|nr:ribose-5-phosphate isomerase RpiA [Thermoplasmataceae archaeon]